jgi:GAF domain-containing protein
MDEPRLRRLLDVGRSLISELEPEVVLQRLLEVARELTGAQYAAIGVLDESRDNLERFLTVGIDEDTHRQIGDLPRGRGVLGVLISDSRPLRLADVGEHPESYGFPLAQPASDELAVGDHRLVAAVADERVQLQRARFVAVELDRRQQVDVLQRDDLPARQQRVGRLGERLHAHHAGQHRGAVDAVVVQEGLQARVQLGAHREPPRPA